MVVYTVGLLGFSTSLRDWMIALTPANLLFSLVLLLLNHREWSKGFIAFVGISMVASFLVEVLGVATGIPFGNYWYGATLGPQLWEVPLLIGVNWFILVYATGAWADRLPLSRPLKAAVGATLMVALDVIMEPVAMQLDFWSWQDGHIPLQNYVGWMLLAFLLHLYFQRLPKNEDTRFAQLVFVMQLVFFAVLRLAL
ncbi:MAG: carotenoid biosynthesis protein [Bacteroidota bacterium]